MRFAARSTSTPLMSGILMSEISRSKRPRSRRSIAMPAVLGQRHVVPFAAQHDRQQLAHRSLVVDDEQRVARGRVPGSRFRVHGSGSCCSMVLLTDCSSLRLFRSFDYCVQTVAATALTGSLTLTVVPSPGCRAHLNFAAVVADDAMDNRQPETGAFRERAAEGLKDRVQLVGGNADAFVAPRRARPSRGRPRRPIRAARRGSAARRCASRADRWSPDSRQSAESGSRRPRTPLRSSGTLNVDDVPFLHFRAVPQQQRRIVEHPTHVEPRNRESLRPRVGKERADRVVQPLRFAQHDVHQLRLLFGQRQLLPENLNRPRHRRERIANLMRDAGRHLADGRQPLAKPRVALELLDVGDILKREQQSGVSAGRLRAAWP